LAIREFQKNEGRFPATLDELPEIDDSQYRGLFSGQPYDYKSDANSFRLRTAGPDLKFNSGENVSRNSEESDDWGIQFRVKR